MFCPKCGKENVEGAVFCGSCGNKIEIQPTNINEVPVETTVETPVSEVVPKSVVTPEQTKPKKSKKILIIIIAALLAVVIV